MQIHVFNASTGAVDRLQDIYYGPIDPINQLKLDPIYRLAPMARNNKGDSYDRK